MRRNVWWLGELNDGMEGERYRLGLCAMSERVCDMMRMDSFEVHKNIFSSII